MAEKKQNIQDGKNIELDGITIINEGISLAEKEEVKEEAKEEAPAEETAEVEITPDVKIETSDNVAEEETKEVAEEPVPEVNAEEIPAPIAIDIDPVAVDEAPAQEAVVSDQVVAPIAEIPVSEEVPAYNVEAPIQAEVETSAENSFLSGRYNDFVSDNRPAVPAIPENIITAFDMAKNEVGEIYLKNQELESKMAGYESAIAEKDQIILDKERQINELSTKVKTYEDKLSLVRNKVLDEFGLGGMAVEQAPAPVAEVQPAATFADDGVTINNDISLAA